MIGIHVSNDPPSSAVLPAHSSAQCRLATAKNADWNGKCYASKDRRVSTRAENHFAFQATTGLGACRDCQLYVDSGEPITLPSADCYLRCSSGILVCGMNFFG
jgi:hypothetical protein